MGDVLRYIENELREQKEIKSLEVFLLRNIRMRRK